MCCDVFSSLKHYNNCLALSSKLGFFCLLPDFNPRIQSSLHFISFCCQIYLGWYESPWLGRSEVLLICANIYEISLPVSKSTLMNISICIHQLVHFKTEEIFWIKVEKLEDCLSRKTSSQLSVLRKQVSWVAHQAKTDKPCYSVGKWHVPEGHANHKLLSFPKYVWSTHPLWNMANWSRARGNPGPSGLALKCEIK